MALLMLLPSGALVKDEAAIGDKTASPTSLTEDSRDTTVTLSLPSDEYKNKVDVVFVMDKSTSTTNNGINFSEQVKELFDSVVERNPTIDLKVGVIKFRGKATDMLGSGLTEYEGNEDAIIAAIANNNVPGAGTNIHGGLDMADELLEADSEVDNSSKYVILLTDGKSYIWNNENNEPTTSYSQYYQKKVMKGNGIPSISQAAPSYDKDAYPVVVSGQTRFWFNDYADLYNSDNEELTGTSKYDYPAYYATTGSTPTGSYNKITTTNGRTLFGNNDYQYYWEYTPSEAWADMVWQEANPYEVIKNDDGTYTFDTETPNPDYYMIHPDHLQKASYMTGHLWSDMNEKYNCGAVIYSGWGGSSGITWVKTFCAWLIENSKYGADVQNASQVEALFDSIDNSISYLVDAGSVVEDKIADEFELKDASGNPFTITVAGEALTATKLGENQWGFNKSGSDDLFVIEYDPSTKIITWTINVPIEIANQVKLSYTLTLDKDAEPGTYPTNDYATLHYKSTDGTEGDFDFPVPKVTYTKKTTPGYDYVFRFTKEWKGEAADEIDFTLYNAAGSKVSKKFKINQKKSTATKQVYEAWFDLEPAGYYVVETPMKNYVTSYENTGDYANEKDRAYNGGVIVNQYRKPFPPTSDYANLALWIGLAVIGAAGLGVLVWTSKKRKAEKK